MPRYTNDVVAGYILYFTSKCIIEAMHVHASDSMQNVKGAAKLFVYENGDTKIERQGTVNEVDMSVIQKYIKLNYKEMFEKWQAYGGEDYYKKR